MEFDLSSCYKPQNLVTEKNLLSFEECKQAIETIDALKNFWRKHPWEAPYQEFDIPFYTLGAASYLDLGLRDNAYMKLCKETNQVLKKNFSWLYEKTLNLLKKELRAPVILNDHNLGIPGFHIQCQSPVFLKTPRFFHFDLHDRILPWRNTYDSRHTLQFTVPIELPYAGGGVDYLNYDLETHEKQNGPTWIQKKPQQEIWHTPYQIGKVYFQNSHWAHRMAWWPKLSDKSERRISFQGHGVFTQGQWQIYW